MYPISTLKFWCYKVIPLVYDDSLSYYELLCKVVDKMNEVITITNQIPDDVKEYILSMLSDSSIISDILEEYLANNNVELKSDLKSGNMPLEYLYQFTFSNSYYANAPSDPHYCEVMQSFCWYDGLIYTVAYDRPDGVNGKVRVYNAETGAKIGSDHAISDCGHAQDCTTNGTYLFVSPSKGEKRIIWYNLNDFSIAGEFTLPVGSDGVSSIAYNYDDDTFITTYSNKCFIWKFRNSQFSLVKIVTVYDEPKADSNVSARFPNMARQGTCYYNGMIIKTYAYCGLVCAFDLETGKRVITYNLPYKTDSGHPIIEPECIDFDRVNKHFYLLQFTNLNGTDFDKSSYMYGTNIFYKLDPFRNVIDNYDNRIPEIEDIEIYVDGDYTGVVQNGNKDTPFHCLEQAISMIQSDVGLFNGTRIMLKRGTNCGVLFGKNVNSIIIDDYGTGSDKPLITGVGLKHCSDVMIRDCEIRYRAGSYAFTLNDETVRCHAYIQHSSVFFYNTDFSCGNVVPDYGVYVTSGSDVKITNVNLDAETGFYADAMSTMRTASIVFGSEITKQYEIKNAFVATAQEYANTIQRDYTNYMHPFDMIMIRNTTIDDNSPHDLVEGTFGDSALNNVQMFVLELTVHGRSILGFVPVHNYSDNSLGFAFEVPSANSTTKAVNYISGIINLNTKKIGINYRWRYDYSTSTFYEEGVDDIDYVTITKVFVI